MVSEHDGERARPNRTGGPPPGPGFRNGSGASRPVPKPPLSRTVRPKQRDRGRSVLSRQASSWPPPPPGECGRAGSDAALWLRWPPSAAPRAPFPLPSKAETRYIVLVRVGDPARRHGVSDADMFHAIRYAVCDVPEVGDERFTMLIGPALSGAYLEVGILDLEGQEPVIIHADQLRRSFRRRLEEMT